MRPFSFSSRCGREGENGARRGAIGGRGLVGGGGAGEDGMSGYGEGREGRDGRVRDADCLLFHTPLLRQHSTFEQASPNGIPVGSQADLSDLVIKSEKDDFAWRA